MTIEELKNFVDELDYAMSPDSEIVFIQYDASDEKIIVDYVNTFNEEIRYTHSLNPEE